MKINKVVGNVGIKLNTDRLDKNLREAQKELNEAVKNDCQPLVPHLNGSLRSSFDYPKGVYGGEISWNTPYAHYQYEGNVYEDPVLHAAGIYTDGVGWWSRSGVKKVKTERKLTHNIDGTTDHWFEEAKTRHKQEWVDLVRKTAGKD